MILGEVSGQGSGAEAIEPTIDQPLIPLQVQIAIDLANEIPGLTDDEKKALVVFYAWQQGGSIGQGYLHRIGYTDPGRILIAIEPVFDQPWLSDEFDSIEKSINSSRQILNEKPSIVGGQRYLARAIWERVSDTDEDISLEQLLQDSDHFIQRASELIDTDLKSEIGTSIQNLTEAETTEYAIKFYKRGLSMEYLSEFFGIPRIKIRKLLAGSLVSIRRTNPGHSKNTLEERASGMERLKSAIELHLRLYGTSGFQLKAIALSAGVGENSASLYYKRFLAEGLPYPPLIRGGYR